MRTTALVILLSMSISLLPSCNKGVGCPGVKSYTENSSGGKKNKGGEGPWTKKSKRKDDRKASSGVVPGRYSKKRGL